MNGLLFNLVSRIPALKECQLDLSSTEMSVIAPTQEVCFALVQDLSALIQEAQLLKKGLTIWHKNQTIFLWHFSQELSAIAREEVPPPPLIAEMPNPPQPLAIVSMETDQAIYITSAMERIGGKACAPGEDTSRWHLPEELRRLRTALEDHGFIREFEYRAFNLERQPIKNTVNAWLVEDWRGSCVRVVELLSQELI